MAEILQRAGTWTFDGDTVRIVPGHHKSVHKLRKLLGEVAVPLAAVAGIAYEPGRRSGWLRLRLRHGADPLLQAAAGRLPDAADPYRLEVEPDRSGVAEYFVAELRNALLLEQVPVEEPCDRYLLPGPPVPLSVQGTDGTASFDGERVRLDWNWVAEGGKSSAGPRAFALHELEGVQWTPAIGWENGSLRFRPKGAHAVLKPEHDPNCLVLWGVRQAKDVSSVLVAAAVTARLPHPSADSSTAAPAGGDAPAALTKGGSSGAGADGRDDPEVLDALLRRLRELGELHREGVLTDEEFTAAKQAVLRRF
ncbi:Tat pathway signal sequence domain protein [Streptomyces carminius]|uniref:Tat pathway signal sequence domain protein n=1 Tax=Streptomyces carminius TaxID=2665496 RepID=A0A2M8LQ85_9ACTN|nr:DUF4429 domain-containing protein [Streptomyces carminius]PJE94124.1 Tat pathway signal sequence domain protein [Streptomyces carminius]